MPEFTIPVVVDFTTVLRELADIKADVARLGEAVEELKKIRLGQEIIVGQEIEEG